MKFCEGVSALLLIYTNFVSQTWDIDWSGSLFAQGVLDAHAESRHYHSLKAHRRRLAVCQNLAAKVASLSVDSKQIDSSESAIRKQVTEELQSVLLQCDAVSFQRILRRE